MLGSVEALHADDGQEVGGDAADLRAHSVEQVAQLLDIGFAGCVVDGRGALGQHGGHDDIGRTCDGGFVQEHIGAVQAVGRNLEDAFFVVIAELCAQLLHSKEVCIEPAASYFVATGFAQRGSAEAGQQRADQQHTATKAGAALQEFLAVQVV